MDGSAQLAGAADPAGIFPGRGPSLAIGAPIRPAANTPSWLDAQEHPGPADADQVVAQGQGKQWWRWAPFGLLLVAPIAAIMLLAAGHRLGGRLLVGDA